MFRKMISPIVMTSSPLKHSNSLSARRGTSPKRRYAITEILTSSDKSVTAKGLRGVRVEASCNAVIALVCRNIVIQMSVIGGIQFTGSYRIP
jgi:hypothetical protein